MESLHSGFDEHRWVIQIQETLIQELEVDDGDEKELPVCMFGVPVSLLSAKPQAYIPQQVAIGPYHQWRTELYEMGRYKLFAAKRTQEHLQELKLEDLVAQFMKLGYKIRACYHRYLDISNETLAWMMVVDASFLLEYLQAYATTNTKSSRVSMVVDYSKKRLTHNAILRDIIMLENQIPLFLLKELLSFFPQENPHKVLAAMLMGLCKALSPFHNKGEFSLSEDELLERDHFLELLYHINVPKLEEISIQDQPSPQNPGSRGQFFSSVSSFFNSTPFSLLRRFLTSRKFKFIMCLPLKIIGKFRIVSSLSTQMEKIISTKKVDAKEEGARGSYSRIELPLVEELMIPKVAQLIEAGVKFYATQGDLRDIKFDKISGVFHLPIISIDENSEVVLRNLVAFEAAATSGPLIFTRYTELMNDIIDTQEDVKLLREKGIIFNHLKSDGEVADIWNGMSKSVKLTKVAHLDKVIEDVNWFYSTRWKIIAGNLMSKYVFASWPLLSFMAANLLLFMTSLQAFCSMYNCSNGLSVKTMIGNTTSTFI